MEKTHAMLLVSEVAERLRASESFVYQAIKEGRLRHRRLGKGQGAIRVTEAMLAEFLACCERGDGFQDLPHLR
jgi:excisionase family DNA binding protein